jgi:hypothetical protein
VRPHEGGKKKDGIEGIHRTCSANRNSHETTIRRTWHAKRETKCTNTYTSIDRSIRRDLGLETWEKLTHLQDEGRQQEEKETTNPTSPTKRR